MTVLRLPVRYFQDNLILLRDATAGVEFPDALDGLQATEMAVREVEQQLGFSSGNPDFFHACQSAR